MDNTEEIVKEQILDNKNIDINLTKTEELENQEPLTWDDVIPKKDEAFDMLQNILNLTAALESIYTPLFGKHPSLKEKYEGFLNSVNELTEKFIKITELHSLPRTNESDPIVFRSGPIENDENGFTNNIAVLDICNNYIMISVALSELTAKVLPIIFTEVRDIINTSDSESEEIKEILSVLDQLGALTDNEMTKVDNFQNQVEELKKQER